MAKDKERVKTYRVLKDGIRHGDSVRNFGAFLPEAPNLETFRTLLNTDIIEEVWVDQEEFDEWQKNQEKADASRLAGIDPDVDDDEDDEDEVPAVKVPKKKVAKKKVGKKAVAKKTVKKGKTSERLEEQSV